MAAQPFRLVAIGRSESRCVALLFTLVLTLACEKALTTVVDDKRVTIAASANVERVTPPRCPSCEPNGLSVQDFCVYSPSLGILDIHAALEANLTWASGNVEARKLIVHAKCSGKGKRSKCDVATIDHTSDIVSHTGVSLWAGTLTEIADDTLVITETGAQPATGVHPRRVTVDFIEQRVRYADAIEADGSLPGSRTHGEGACKGGVQR